MPKIPEQIGKYKILSCLGSGGTSIVYLGIHPTLKRKVVLKKLNLRGKKAHYERFRQEAALMMDLNHDHIVRVFDHFREGNRHYIVMEFVEGSSLDGILARTGPLPPGLCRYILIRCCRAVLYVHSRGVIHRDIKPSNIFISKTGEVKLGDFGIATQDADDKESGNPGPPIGTPSYMAPEQFLPGRGLSRRTDIYALGVTLYELLTGRKLYDGRSLEELKQAVLKGRHASLLPIFRKAGPLFFWIIRRSIFRSSRFRFSSGSRIIRLLRMTPARPGEEASREVLIRAVEEGMDKSASGKRNSVKKKQLSLSVQEAPVGRGKSGLRRLQKGVFLVLLLALLGGCGITLLRTGLWYRWFRADRKGAFTVKVLETSEIPGPAGEILLYRDRTRFLEPLGELTLSDDNPGQTDVQYRDRGAYRILTRWGNQVEWISFYLPPLSERQDVLDVEVVRPAPVRKNLNIHLDVRDALTGRDITGTALLEVQADGNQWTAAGELPLLTGQGYRFRVSLEGYISRFFNIPVLFYQDELRLRADLIPEPGRVVISHDLDRLSVKVNGKSRFPGGDPQLGDIRAGRLPEGDREWALSPGDYVFSWHGRDWEEERLLRIHSGDSYRILIRQEPDGAVRIEEHREIF